MRRGKEIAQGAHASMAFMSRKLQKILPYSHVTPSHYFSTWEREWIDGDFTKITLQVNSEKELLDLYNNLKDKFECHLIQDKGLTEFGGVPTYTALGIGPHYSHLIDEFVGPEGKYPLKLY